VPVLEKPLAKMRSEEPYAACNQNAFPRTIPTHVSTSRVTKQLENGCGFIVTR
jgi:hypothetical protein